MDKKVVFAVAGSGKTKMIIDSLSLNERALIITYTNNNYRNLRQRIIQKFGEFPKTFRLYTYFKFLYQFCYRPLYSLKYSTRGIYWKNIPNEVRRFRKTQKEYYLTANRRLFHNRISMFLIEFGGIKDVQSRITKYFESLYIDEVQDFGGNDFNFLMAIAETEINLILVGDFFQHTFVTSHDGNTNASLHKDYIAYKNRFAVKGLEVDVNTLHRSYRCSRSVCEFITQQVGIEIFSVNQDFTKVEIIEEEDRAITVFNDNNIIKLFYNNHVKYPCYSQNWGQCKGENHYQDVCIVLSKTNMKKLRQGKLSDVAPLTKNKLYVACSRANRDLYFISEESIRSFRVD